MSASLWLLWGLTAVLAVLAWRKGRLLEAGRIAVDLTRSITIRLSVAVFAAGFMAQALPEIWLSRWLGHEAGVSGILLASLLGMLIPAGPMVLFPIAVALGHAGVGAPQLVALITGWSLIAPHRFFGWELPFMGLGFSWRRAVASIAFAPLAGLAALVLQRI